MSNLEKFKYYAALLLLVSTYLSFGQNPEVDSVLINTKKHYTKIDNLECDADISIEIPNLRMPKKRVKIYYKKPDSFQVKSKGIVIFPDFGNYFKILNNLDTIDYRSQNISNDSTISIITENKFFSSSSNEILAKIDKKRYLIEKINIRGDDSKYSEVQFSYSKVGKYAVPNKIQFHLNFDRGIPEFSPPSIESPFGETDLFKNLEDKDITGKITINFFNYNINTEINEKVFMNEGSD